MSGAGRPPGAGFALLLGGLAGLAPFAIDTYLPAFPEMARGLNAPSALVQQTLTAYLVASTAAILVHGPLSDRFGRRRVIIAALVVFSIGSTGCALATDVRQLLAWRAVQGLAAGAGIVVGRALVRDHFAGADATRMMARVNLAFTVAPAVAPLIGGHLLEWAGWRAIFWFLLAYPLALLAACLALLPPDPDQAEPTPLSLALIARQFVGVLSAPGCFALALTMAASFSAFFLYILAAPTFVRTHLGLAATQFHWLFVPTVTGSVVGSLLAARLSARLSPAGLVRAGLAVSATAAALNLALHAFAPPGMPWSVLPVALCTCGNGLLMPGATLLLLDRSPFPRGATSSVQSFVQSLGSSLTAALLVPWLAPSALTLACGMAGWLLVSAAAWKMANR